MEKRPLAPTGGLFIPGRSWFPAAFSAVRPEVGGGRAGADQRPLATVGCAVASAAMVLAGYGIDTDPGRLNAFLNATKDGYTPEGCSTGKGGGSGSGIRRKLLPHYEDKPSFCLIDCNLLRGNPVIIRLRYTNGERISWSSAGNADGIILSVTPDPAGSVAFIRSGISAARSRR